MNLKYFIIFLRLSFFAVKILFFTFYFLLFTFFISCKKDKNTIHIRGNIYDPNQKINVRGARVILQSSTVQSGMLNGSYQDIANASTDVSGKFSFDIAVERVLGYKMLINKDKYFYSETDIGPLAWSGGNTYNPVYKIYPLAYIKLDIQNVHPYNTDDVIYYTIISDNFQLIANNCSGCCSESLQTGTGMTFSTKYKCITQGATTTLISWNYTKNKINIARDTNLYCIPFDTNSFKILY
jgi:hypothetical protein